MHDRRRGLLTAGIGFALLPVRRDQAEVGLLRRWLDTWTVFGLVTVGMARQGYDLQLTRYAEQGWRANFSHRHRALGRLRERVGTDAMGRGAAGGLGSFASREGPT